MVRSRGRLVRFPLFYFIKNIFFILYDENTITNMRRYNLQLIKVLRLSFQFCIISISLIHISHQYFVPQSCCHVFAFTPSISTVTNRSTNKNNPILVTPSIHQSTQLSNSHTTIPSYYHYQRNRNLQLHDIDPKSLLYGEQEKLLVNRGILENELMVSKAKTVALPSNIVKGSEGGGGFGKKSSSSSSSSANKAAAKSHAKVLTKEGVVRIDNVLSPALADTIRQSVYTMRQESEILVQSGTLPSISRFADVLLKSNRCDMTIPIGLPWVANALSSILVDSPVGKVMEVLLGQDCILYELSSLMSDPGSQRQVVHPDTPYREEPVLYTCFVALQDIELDMGPTTWLPQTHTKEIHEIFNDNVIEPGQELSPKDHLLKTRPHVLGLLPKGSCAIFDSRLLHCGGANTSQTSRALFYFTFKNPRVSNVGNPGSIRRDMIGKWTLSDLQKELVLYQKGKATDRLIFDIA